MRIFNQHPSLFYFQHAITGIAQLKNIPGDTFKGEVLIEGSYTVTLRQHDDLIIEVIRDGPAVLQRCQARRRPAT